MTLLGEAIESHGGVRLWRQLEQLRGAVADLLYALGSAFQNKPEEAYWYVSRAVALLRLEIPSMMSTRRIWQVWLN